MFKYFNNPELITPRQHQSTSEVLKGTYQQTYKATQNNNNYKSHILRENLDKKTQVNLHTKRERDTFKTLSFFSYN
jgi:hypothetical protein